MSKVPQCPTCPISTYQRGLPATRTDPPEPGGHYCGVTEEFIPEGQEPFESECQILTGWLAVPPHKLDAAIARKDYSAAAKWLRENVPAEVLRQVRPEPSASYVDAWNAHSPRADGRVEN